jgi:hypothetical protein
MKFKIHRTTILPVVLCRCKTWTLTLREDRILGKRELRKRVGPKRVLNETA